MNEVWDLIWHEARRELGYKLMDSAERVRSLFMEALQTCVARVKEEGP